MTAFDKPEQIPLRVRAAAAALVWSCGLAACSASDGPSVVLVTIDTLRADHLSGYGYEKPTSPTLDRLMQRGTTFSWAFSTSSSTQPSHVSIMTGLYPPFHSVGAYNGRYVLDDEADTLAERLRRLGFRTAAVVSNPVLSRSLGLAQGFEAYDDELEGTEVNRETRERYADSAVDKALALIETFGDERFFLWLHLQDPHGPYDPPAPWLERFPADGYTEAPELPAGTDHSGYRSIPRYQLLGDERSRGGYVRRYDAEIAFADAELGRLVEHLDRRPARRGLLLAVTADHGEALGEDDFYFAHSHSLELDLVRVPLVIVGPGAAPGKREVRAVSNAWLFDTILRFAGDRAQEADSASRDLLRAARGDPSWEPEPVYMDNLNQVAVAHGDRFLRRDRYPKDADGVWNAPNPNSGSLWRPLGTQLRALESPGPRRDVRGLARLLAGHMPAMDSWPQRMRGAEPAPVTPERLRALRALGYVE